MENKQTRLSEREALRLLREVPTADLMEMADARKRALHGDRIYYVHSHNLNPTNRCDVHCKLCSFWKEDWDQDAYTMSLEDANKDLERSQGWGLTDLHIVGGMVPELDLPYYEALFSLARKKLPGVLLQGMTAVEIEWIASHVGVSIREVLNRLKQCGFGSISGGGAEIFHSDVRRVIATKKISAQAWLDVHRTAHELEIPTNATMLFGHIETDEHLIDHLSRLRTLQDETDGFLAAIPLPFQANGSALGLEYGPSGDRQVRVAALTRLFLDNFPHVRMLVNYMDRKLLGVLTHSGVDDIGGTSLNERIAKAAGAPQNQKFVSAEEMDAFLVQLGHTPVLTNSIYDGVSPAPASVVMREPEWVPILKRVEQGERLNVADAELLLEEAPFQALGRVADQRRSAAVPGPYATYVFDRNLNVTNVCQTECSFCAFYVSPESEKGYVLTPEQVAKKVKKSAEAGATQILIQGGLNPQLNLEYYEACLSAIRDTVDIWIHSMSPTEIEYLAHQSGLTIRETLVRLQQAGLQSLPGGGAEILVDEIRKEISPKKTRSKAWLEVMREAHLLGMKSTATMVYGFGETAAQRIEHLLKVRELQDETGGFTAFIPWSFQSNKTDLDRPGQTGVDYLRMIALARLVLDNVPHLQAGWVTEGPDLAQLALRFGADDFGGVLMTEEVVSATGVDYGVNEAQVIRLIRETGRIPVQRSTQYDVIQIHQDTETG